MRPHNSLQRKILTLSDLQKKIAQWRLLNKTIVFTNGCFDILHAGHIASLTEAAGYGDVLIVALNSDLSACGLKGKNRPINDEQSRALILAALIMIDAVIIFSEPTPLEIIIAAKPDVLVKGGDYKIEEIAGAGEVIANGGKVIINPIKEGFSTSSIVSKIQNS